MTTKYTTAETQHLIKVYKDNPNRTTVDMLSKEMGKTVKSVIGKLSREKVYQKIEYKTKRGEKPITKLEMTQQLAVALKGDAERLESLTKASKQDLLYLQVLVEDMLWECGEDS